MRQPRIPTDRWHRLDADERARIAEYIDSLIYQNYQKEKTRTIIRASINRLHELVPPPLLFATLASFFSFAVLFILPAEPISMAIAFGAGLALALILQTGIVIGVR